MPALDTTNCFPVNADVEGLTSVRVEFDTNGASDPDGLIDRAQVVDQTVNSSGLDQPASGKYTVTLKGKYKRIRAHVVLEDDTLDLGCRIYQIDDVDTSGVPVSPAVIYIMTTTGTTGAALQTNNKHVLLDLDLAAAD